MYTGGNDDDDDNIITVGRGIRGSGRQYNTARVYENRRVINMYNSYNNLRLKETFLLSGFRRELLRATYQNSGRFPFFIYLMDSRVGGREAVRARRITPPPPPPCSSSRAPGRFRSVFTARGFRSICPVEQNINNTATSPAVTRVLALQKKKKISKENKKNKKYHVRVRIKHASKYLKTSPRVCPPPPKLRPPRRFSLL